MGEAPEGLEIDRILNDFGYEKDNCRWTTHAENVKNKRGSDFAAVVSRLTDAELAGALRVLARIP